MKNQNLSSNKILFIIFFSLSLISCKTNKADKNILSQKEFINILVDIHLANATLNYMQADKNWENYKAKDYYPSILKTHNVTEKKLQETIQYYIKSPVKYDAVYDSVINRLSIMQGEITKKVIKKNK